MKSYIGIFLFFLLPFSALANNDPNNGKLEGAIDDIVAAFKKADAAGVAKYMDVKVNMNILGKKDNYSKSQAETVLKSFFTKNRPSSFSINHDGNSPGGDKFFIANLKSGASTYRVYVYLKKSGADYKIKELRIEKP